MGKGKIFTVMAKMEIIMSKEISADDIVGDYILDANPSRGKIGVCQSLVASYGGGSK